MKYLFEKCLIKDGITLSALKTDKYKAGILKLSIAIPSDEAERKTTLFGLMINVLRCGTEKYPEKSDIIKRLGDLYDATCSIGGYASGDNQIFEISSELLSDRFSEDESILSGVAELMSQMLFHPALDNEGKFRSDTVEREKKVICDRIKSEKNNTREYSFKRCREIMCQGEPYGRSMKPDMLISVTAEELTEYYREFLRTASISFSYIGDKSINEVADILRKHFGDTRFDHAPTLIPLSCKQPKETLETTEEMNVKQGVLILGFRSGILIGDRLADAVRVFNNIYGGTCTSRLFTTVREKMSLCYYCDSDYVSTKGLVFVSCGIDVSNKEIAQSEILRQLSILQTEEVSKSELEAAKDMAVKETLEMSDYPGAVASFTYAHEMYGLSADLEQKLLSISSVTAAEVMETAKSIQLDTVFFLKGTAVEDEYDG